MSFSPRPGTKYKLEDIARELFDAQPDHFVVLRGHTFECCTTYNEMTLLPDLTALRTSLQTQPVFSIQYPEDGALPGAISYQEGKPNVDILDEYGFLEQDGTIVQVLGYDPQLRALLQSQYEAEKHWRDESHSNWRKEQAIALVKQKREEREARERILYDTPQVNKKARHQ